MFASMIKLVLSAFEYMPQTFSGQKILAGEGLKLQRLACILKLV